MANTRLFRPKDGRRQHKRYRIAAEVHLLSGTYVTLEDTGNHRSHEIPESVFNKRYEEV